MKDNDELIKHARESWSRIVRLEMHALECDCLRLSRERERERKESCVFQFFNERNEEGNECYILTRRSFEVFIDRDLF